MKIRVITILTICLSLFMSSMTVCAYDEQGYEVPFCGVEPTGVYDYYSKLIANADANDDIFQSVYSLYDFDKDGNLELIIDNNESHNTRVVSLYKYDSEPTYIGSFMPYYGVLCNNPQGGGIVMYNARKNYEWLELVTYNGSEFNIETITESKYIPPDPDMQHGFDEPQEILPGAYRLETCPTNSDLLLRENINETVQTEQDIRVVLNGQEIEFDQSPVMLNDRTLVPVRAIFEALDAEVDWNDDTQTVTSTKGSTTVKLIVGEKYLIKNGALSYFDVPAQIINNRTLVPVRAIAELFGAEVSWDESSQTVYIDTSAKINAIIINADGELTDNDAGLVRSVLLKNKMAKVNEDNFHSAYEPSESYFNSIIDITVLQAGEDDTTFFFYSGHGGDDGHISPIYNNQTHDGSFTLRPIELINVLDRIPGTIVIMLDSCFSGAINELPDLNTDKFKIITSSEAVQTSSSDNLTMISSEQIGKFSEALLNGLGGLDGGNIIYNTITKRDGKVKADYNKDGLVTLSELYTYIDRNMDKEYTDKYGNKHYQNPTVSDINDQTVIYTY